MSVAAHIIKKFPIGFTLCVAALFLAACGFHLRGTYTLPWPTLAIDLPPTSSLRALIKRQIEASTTTRIVDDTRDAPAILNITDSSSKEVLSLDSGGRVREYRLTRSFAYRVSMNAAPSELSSAQTGDIVIHRDITYSDAQVLSKESEEALLLRDMQNDLVQQLLRRLSTLPLTPSR
jgi:LPS-assembly lipoprotein